MTLSKHEKKSLIGIKTLAMMKMEKNFIAYTEKGYPRKPYQDKNQSIDFLLDRIEDELEELTEANEANNLEVMLEELADISNIIDYLYEKVLSKFMIQSSL